MAAEPCAFCQPFMKGKISMPKLSIIVPIYKAESYLQRSLDSILNQDLQDWELILVDDGSPDRSLSICEAYAEKDSRIRVIHQNNSGVSAARNRGLQEAGGDWIGFVDADDWIHEKMFLKMLSAAGEANMVMCDAMTVFEDGREEEDTISVLPESRVLFRQNCTPELMPEFAGAVWRCIYRKELLKSHKIVFPLGQKFSEDRVFNLYAMGFSESIVYLKEPLYFRYVNMGSCVNSFHGDYALQEKLIHEETEKAIDAAFDGSEAMKQAYWSQYADVYFRTLVQLRQKNCPLTDFQRLEEVKKICENEDLRRMIQIQKLGGLQGKLILKRKYQAILHYNNLFYRNYEKWLNLWYSTWLCQKIWNLQERLGLRL